MGNKSALLIIDVQNDFCPGGALPVPDGDKVVSPINKISPVFFKVIATQDWHPPGHISFAGTHGKKPFETITLPGLTQVLWPDHCVPGTWGAEFHRDLDLRHVDMILRKGNNPGIDSYSAFLENDKKTETGLHHYLHGLEIDTVYLCGLATDYCVYFSALDARYFDFNTFVILDASRGIDIPENSIAGAVDEMKKRGVHITSHDAL